MLGRPWRMLAYCPCSLMVGMLPSRLWLGGSWSDGRPLERSSRLVRLGPLSMNRGSLGAGWPGCLMVVGPASAMGSRPGRRFPVGFGLVSGRGRSVVLNRLGRGLLLAFEKA